MTKKIQIYQHSDLFGYKVILIHQKNKTNFIKNIKNLDGFTNFGEQDLVLG